MTNKTKENEETLYTLSLTKEEALFIKKIFLTQTTEPAVGSARLFDQLFDDLPSLKG